LTGSLAVGEARGESKGETNRGDEPIQACSTGDVPQSTQTNCSSVVFTTGALQLTHFTRAFLALRG